MELLELIIGPVVFLTLATLFVADKLRVSQIQKTLNEPIVILKLDQADRKELLRRFSSFFNYVEPSPSKEDFPSVYEARSGNTIILYGQIIKFSSIFLVVEILIGLALKTI